MKPDSESTRETLDWQAYRYIANEMSSQEQSDFELLLADDQAAREAVAQAVELTQTIYAAELFSSPHAISHNSVADSPAASAAVEPAPISLRSRNWLVPVGWITVGAVACLALVLSVPQLIPRTGPEIGMAPDLVRPGKASVELAEAWSAQTLHEGEGELEEPALDPSAAWKEESEWETPLAENHAPAWMLEAVRREAPDTADEEMES
jgi:hypothetical protein